MLVPSIFGRDMFDDFGGFGGFPFGSFHMHDMMKTDVKDTGKTYELTMDMPGVSKEDIKAELKGGYLTISAESNSSKDEKDENGRYICRERRSGSCSRSFYVGEGVNQDDIDATFENGTLMLSIPKKEAKPELDGGRFINIKGIK